MEYPPIAPVNRRPPAARGFTAIELMVVISIVAILAALAAPSFTPLIERWRVRSAVEGLQSTVYFARSEAIKRGGNVVLQKLPTGTNGCTAADNDEWHCGWFVCEDTNGNNSCSSSEPVLQRFDAPTKLNISRTSTGASISFNRWGLTTAWFGFTVIPQGKPPGDSAVRGVCVGSGGRVRIIAVEDTPCKG